MLNIGNIYRSKTSFYIIESVNDKKGTLNVTFFEKTRNINKTLFRLDFERNYHYGWEKSDENELAEFLMMRGENNGSESK